MTYLASILILLALGAGLVGGRAVWRRHTREALDAGAVSARWLSEQRRGEEP